jgi:hypothetical protein
MAKAKMPTARPTRKLTAGGMAGAISAPFTVLTIYTLEQATGQPLPGEVAGAIGTIITMIAVLLTAYLTSPSPLDTPIPAE